MTMLQLITALAISLLGTTSALASDIPRPPSRPLNITTPVIVSQPSFIPYVGGELNYSSFYNSFSGNVNVGGTYRNFLSTELNYDFSRTPTRVSHMGSGMTWLNGPQLYKITPQIGAGLGYRWRTGEGNEAFYTLGAGVKLELTQAVDVNVRYRFVEGFRTRQHDHLVTAGFSFKF